ncbi:MAG TPA: sugar phosphate nucleotidyltransferase [Acidobacteriota bacterium]|nr:sugar phosphate nucleotidyltransferase [Acidobacteriota bacterium]
MKGVVLAGGLGRRLGPLTAITNKHLLPVWDRPMIFYPLRSLIEAGIDEVLIVTGGQNPGDFMRLLGDGGQFGFRGLYYTYQKGQGGIADALAHAADFAAGEKVCVILGDNILQKSLRPQIEAFAQQTEGARILLKKVPDPQRFGVACFNGRRLDGIVEKPRRPPSPYAVIGVYFYGADVFDITAGLTPSGRGELEITDVTNTYLRRGTLTHGIMSGWWTDAGTVESLHRAASLAARTWFGPRSTETFWPPFDHWVTARVVAGTRRRPA